MTPATICFPFVGNLVGGSHISAEGLIRHLDRSRFRPLILPQYERGPIADLFEGTGATIEIAPPTPELGHGKPVIAGTALRLAAAAPRLARFLRRRNCEIVHCNDGRTLATWALPAKLAGVKLLWHHRGAPTAAGLRLLAPILADRVVAVSHFAAPPPGRYSAAARTHVIHSPFDTETRHDRRKARASLLALLPDAGPRTRVVAFSGAFIDRKRPILFVDAIAALRRASPDRDIRGVMLGESLDGMADRVRTRAADLGVEDAIHVLGHRTPGPFWLAGCDLLMVPAIDEPFGRTLIEAMLVGTPVVATASGGNIEAIRDSYTGVLVPPEDAEALALGCLSLLDNRSRATAIADTALAEAEARFGEVSHAEAIMALYGSMLTPRARVKEASTPKGHVSNVLRHGQGR